LLLTGPTTEEGGAMTIASEPLASSWNHHSLILFLIFNLNKENYRLYIKEKKIFLFLQKIILYFI
jgi:hypothetical protein